MYPSSVLILTSSLEGCGAGNYILNLARFLRSRSIRAVVCTMAERVQDLEAPLFESGIELRRAPLRSLKSLFRPGRLASFAAEIGWVGPELVHANLFHAEFAAALAAPRLGVPVVTTRHGSGLEFGGARRWAIRLLRSRIRKVIAVSPGAAEEARSTGLGGRIEIIPNGIDTSRFRPLEAQARPEAKRRLLERLTGRRVTGREMVIGTAGVLKTVKNFPLLVRAFAEVAAARGTASQPPLRLLIIGRGPLREELCMLARKLGIEDLFLMPGYMDRLEEVLPLLDLFVLPSLTEGVPLALLEAMSSGVASVATDVGGIGEVLRGAGVLLPPDDLRALVDALAGLISDERQRSAYARKGRERIQERYDLETWGKRTLEAYSSVIP